MMTVIAAGQADLQWSRDVIRSPPSKTISSSFWRMVSLLEDSDPGGRKSPAVRASNPRGDAYLRRCREFARQNAEGDTQLHVAVVQELPMLVESMVRSVPHAGLLDIGNDDRQTPLHLAVLTRQPGVVRCLLEAGADPGKRDRLGNTALHLACQLGDLASVRELTPHGKTTGWDLDVRNFEGETCAHVAGIHGHVDVLGWLAGCGADLNAREGKSGNTVLHLAVERSIERVARYLLEECAHLLQLGTKNYAGLTAFDLAVGINPLVAGLIASLREARGENCARCSRGKH